ncbi:DNA polymerase III subunit beta [Neisseria shayeganii]|uniref:Beta sliding clamp n=1 Tax=Neisseria shayeganii TaxID=607712 RepID=A0A7D7NBA3_9NEIS|nr:DNA polymerase III subunit beta [Neisseria shayeganii]QMT41279.1 DNA polymerase III subunit beta [Neisseria shayeganii]
MDLSINNTDFADLIAAPASAAARRSTLPILSNLLIRREAGLLTVTGSDLEIQISSTLPSEGEDFEISADAHKLSAIAKAAPTGAIVIRGDIGKLNVKAGGRYTLPTLPAQDFLLIKTAGDTTTLQCKQGELKTLLKRTLYAAPVNDIRHYLNGLLLKVKDNVLHIVGTDGHRLAAGKIELIEGGKDMEVILPHRAASEIIKRLADNEDPVFISVHGLRHADIRIGGTTLRCLLIDGKFPDWERVLPSKDGKKLNLNRQPLLDMLERIEIMLDRSKPYVNLAVSADKLTASYYGTDGAIEDHIPASFDGGAMEIAFNAGYLKEALRNIPGDTVDIYLSTYERAALIVSAAADTLQTVVMPARN